jgi:hypothetical protein
MANNIDERLLAGNTLAPEEEGEAARELRERRQGAAGEEPVSAGEGEDAESPASLRDWASAVRQAANIRRQAMDLKKAKGELEQAVAAPIRQATNKLLQQAWLNLIDSFGLTLIYINIHVFLRFVVGKKLFCKLGQEWPTKQISEAAEPVSKGLGLFEVMVLLSLDFIALSVIFGALAIIYMIVNFLGASWWGKLTQLWDAFWTLGWGGISALSSIFGK